MQLFPTLKTVDSLYQSFVINLVIAHKQGRLINALNQPSFQSAILDLIQQACPEKRETLQGTDSYMKELIRDFNTANNDIDWVRLQLELGASLREVVVTRLEKDLVLQNAMKAELSRVFDLYLDAEMAVVKNFEYFEGIPEVVSRISRHKIPSGDKSIRDQQKNDFQAWLNSAGFDIYLKSLAQKVRQGLFSGELECKLLSHIFNIRIQYYSPEERDTKDCHIIEGFKQKFSGRKLLTFSLQYSYLHWDVAFQRNDNIIKKALATYLPQREHYHKTPRTEHAFPIKLAKSELPSTLLPNFKARSYFTMLFALTLAMLFCSHCMFLPILFPLFHCASWLTHGVALGLSLSLSFAVTEKFQKTQNNGLLNVLFFKPDFDSIVLKQDVAPKCSFQLSHDRGVYFSKVHNRPISGSGFASHNVPSIETIPLSLQSKPR